MKWIPGIPVDKQMHFLVGVGIAILFVVLTFAERMVLSQMGYSGFMQLHPWFWALINAGICVHVSKEGTDWIDNRLMKAMGQPPLHSVDPWDAVAGELGTLALALALLWAGVV